MSQKTRSNQDARNPARAKRKRSKETAETTREAALNPSLPRVLQDIRSERKKEKVGLWCEAGESFRRAAAATSRAMGSAWAFGAALLAVVIWAATGKMFGYSENWQLVINTGTTIVTFLMIFLVQNSQNRDSRAIQLKLDELLRGVKGARTAMVDLENATDEELERLQEQFKRLRKEEEDAKAAANGDAEDKETNP